MNTAQRIAKAEADFEVAQKIVSGDHAAAEDYAQRSLDHYIAINGPDGPQCKTRYKRERYLAAALESAIACAPKIIADGRAHYRDEHGLIVCTLARDPSAGPVGYDRW